MNILITSAGRRTYLIDYFKKVLGENGEVHAANSDFSPALSRADKWVITPMIYGEGYIDFLFKYVLENKIKVVIPLFDIDLPVLALSKKLFREKGIEVLVSDIEAVRVCNDKLLTYKFLLENSFYSPKTTGELEEAIKGIEEKKFSFPLMVKPRWGMGSIGVYRADNLDELRVFYNKIRREIDATYLKYESMEDQDRPIIIQEYLLGEEYGLDVFNDLEGRHRKTFCKRKIAMRAGETDRAVTVENEGLVQLGEKLALSLGHIGNLDVDCFIVGSEIYVLEMNCRFGGGYPFTHLAGANLPKALLDLYQKKDLDPQDLDLRYNLEMAKEIIPYIIHPSSNNQV